MGRGWAGTGRDGTGGEGRGISSPRVEKLNFEGTSRSSFDRLKRFYDHLGLYGGGGDKIRVWRYVTLNNKLKREPRSGGRGERFLKFKHVAEGDGRFYRCTHGSC